MKPDYEPKLFGVPMEWDEDLGYWQDYACISVYIGKDDLGSFDWIIESSSGAEGFATVDEATRDLEKALLQIRQAIPEGVVPT